MDPIQQAIEYLESREGEEKLSYRKVAEMMGVNRTTLARRHQRVQGSRDDAAHRRQLLNPQQELELTIYIERCTRRGLPPTRKMIQNFARVVAKSEVSESWVTRFLHRHHNLITKWSAGLDRNRHKAGTTSTQGEALELAEYGYGDSWRQLRKLFDAAVPDKAKVEAQQLSAALHSLQTQNELLHHKRDSLIKALNAKKKRAKKSNTLNLQQHEYHSNRDFWSPRDIREARAREAAKQANAEQLQHQKALDREVRAEAAVYKKRQAEASKAARLRAKEARDQAKKLRAEELAARRALKKQQQQQAATTQKSHDTAKKAKRKCSHKAAKKPTKRRYGVEAASQSIAGPPAASPPPKITAHGRKIKTPTRYK